MYSSVRDYDVKIVNTVTKEEREVCIGATCEWEAMIEATQKYCKDNEEAVSAEGRPMRFRRSYM